MLLLTTAVTTMASLLFGLIPALHATKPDVIPVLKDETASGGARRSRLRQTLVVAQIGIAVMLVVDAGLLVRSLSRVTSGPGFDPRPVITIRLRPSLVDYPTGTSQAFQREVISRLEALPGVVSASPGDGFAAQAGVQPGNTPAVIPAGRGRSEYTVNVRLSRIGPRYFATLGVPMVEGREFDDRDNERAPLAAVVNDVLARDLGPAGQVTGKTVTVDGASYRIVGVVRDAQYYTAGQTPHAVLYRSYWQGDGRDAFSRIPARSSGSPATPQR